MVDIINIKHYTDALRNTGYKNTESAIAEIVDNSLEAKAKNVLLCCTLDSELGRNKICEIGILDNGSGMNLETLQKSLSIGEGTRRERSGMGRFGVGLPQASLHVAPRVEVYSWQKPNEVYMVYLDVNEVKSGTQINIKAPVKSEIPENYKKYFTSKLKISGVIFDSFEKKGTLVIWRNCDRLNPKTINPLFERFKELLGRKFRYFISEKKHEIGLSVTNTGEFDVLIKPNDPLYLMKNNMILGDPERPGEKFNVGEPIFHLWENGNIIGTKKQEIKFLNKKNKVEGAIVEVTFSIVKEPYLQKGGESEIGKHCKKNAGISIIRANREIDFGKFDFYEDINEPIHRWWGCEIRFQPELDEAFGVANNKQHVELYELDSTDYTEDEVQPVWLQLKQLIRNEIKNMKNHNESLKKGSRSGGGANSNQPEEVIVDEIEKNNSIETSSQAVKEKQSVETLISLVRSRLIEGGNPDPDEDEIKKTMHHQVKIEKRDLGDNSMFIDITTRMGNCWLTINTGSVFYRNLYSKIEEEDESIIRAFNLLLMAFARAEDEAYRDNNLSEAFKDVREKWGSKLRKYLNSDYNA